MTDPSGSPSVETLADRLERGDIEGLSGEISAYTDAEPERRAELLRRLRSVAAEDAGLVSPLVQSIGSFLTDEERSVRLTTAKLFVVLSRDEPDAVVDEAETLADRVADDGEFYYVRARAAEALGYVAAEFPEGVATPDLLADLRIGLSFDEPEVKEKLAKALAYVALGDPERLRYQAGALAEHLDDENDLVRYHLATAVVAVGCELPAALEPAGDDLAALADDPNPYVRGRAAEAMALLSRTEVDVPLPDDWGLEQVEREAAADFLEPRVRFAVGGEPETEGVADIGAIRQRTDAVVEAITTPDSDGCPHCGLALPAAGPPFCPRCGRPL